MEQWVVRKRELKLECKSWEFCRLSEKSQTTFLGFFYYYYDDDIIDSSSIVQTSTQDLANV